jgi:DNA-binding IclR family transcriptional regulator
MKTNTEPDRTVKTAERVFDILEYLEQIDTATIKDVADHVEIAKSTAYTYLATFEKHEYITKQDGAYTLGLKSLETGIIARKNLDITSAAESIIQQVAEKTGETVWIVVEEHSQAVYLLKCEGENAVQTRGEVGKRTTLHDIAAGKAILAHMDEAAVKEIIEYYGLPARTDQTITNADALFDELTTVRERGYAVNRGETTGKLRAVASPIIVDETVHGAIGVAGPKNRLSGERLETTLPSMIQEAADTIVLNLTYS